MNREKRIKKRTGRVSIGLIFGLMLLIMVTIVVVFSQDSPKAAGTRFMDALARHDVKAVTALSFMGKKSPAEKEKEWEQTINVIGKHYGFYWRVTGDARSSDTEAAVKMIVQRNIQSGSTYDEKFELPMLKVDGKWLVDVNALDRRLFPGLP